MKRRDLFRKSATSAAGIGFIPIINTDNQHKISLGNRENDKWHQVGTGKMAIPNLLANDPHDLAKTADLIMGSSTVSGDVKFLLDGVSCDRKDEIHHWEADGLNAELQLEWENPLILSKVELKGETVVERKMMMHKNPGKYTKLGQVKAVPPELIKTAAFEVRISGNWVEVAKIEENITRFEPVKTTAVRIILQETWGYKNAKLYEVRCYA